MPDTTDHFRIAYALPDDYVNAYPGATAQRAATTIDSILYSLYNRITALETIEKLPSGDHSLDDYTETGQHLYHQMLNGNATSDRNYPAQLAGVLISITLGQFSYQIYWTLSSDNTIYYRTRYSTTWHPWKQVSTAAELDAFERRVGAAEALLNEVGTSVGSLSSRLSTAENSLTGVAGRLSLVESVLTVLVSDTGDRDITDLFNGISGGKAYLSRAGRDVTLQFDALRFSSAGTLTGIVSLPSGFRPRPTYSYFSTAQRNELGSPIRGLRISKYGSIDFYEAETSHTYYATLTFKTFDDLPTTLPGSPA